MTITTIKGRPSEIPMIVQSARSPLPTEVRIYSWRRNGHQYQQPNQPYMPDMEGQRRAYLKRFPERHPHTD